MTQVPIARGSHAVRFFESEEHAHRTIADYFIEDARLDDHCIMIARPNTFAGVLRTLAPMSSSGTLRVADRIRFVDADASLAEFMRGEVLNREHAEDFCMRLLSRVPAGGENTRIRLYGELVDVLCERGHRPIAIQIEDLAGLLFALEPRLSILCGYNVRHFAGETGAAEFRAVCGKHTDIGPLHDPCGAVNAREEIAAPPGVAATTEASLPIVYVVDDDASMRRSLARLLTLSTWQVRVFDSAETFLKEADLHSDGCLVVDIQLGGMTGLELMALLEARGLWLPVIAMSGFHDERFESEATRLGACAFLHKPFEPQFFLDVIARALRSA
jgi:CheY-like chemotaxis protein